MEGQEILARLRERMKAASESDADWDAVTAEARIDTLGLDSLAMLDLMYDIQEAFRVRFAPEDLAKLDTVADLVQFIKDRMRL